MSDKPSSRFQYRGANTREISFPLGGIGSGCIGLAGNGRLIDWEIFNRPSKGSTNGFSHFAIRAEKDGEVIDARVLNGDLQPPYSGEIKDAEFRSFGFGPSRDTMAGVPHFSDVTFEGRFPLAELTFQEEVFPGRATMTAFNPFIPLNDRDSSIPAAMFAIDVENTSDGRLGYTICLSVQNPLPEGTTRNDYSETDAVKQIHLTSDTLAPDDVAYGEMTMATDADSVSYQEYWFRGAWFDNLTIYWKDLNTAGPFTNRAYAPNTTSHHKVQSDLGLLAAHISLEPGESRTVRFVISWNFPNNHNYWNPVETDGARCDCADGLCCAPGESWRNYYASLFESSTASAAYCLKEWDRLYGETKSFQEALFASTLPDYALDAVSANLSVLKSPTCLRLEDGTFYGWEGCNCQSGCCEGSCTHVWNYAYALPFLFPQLERSMRHVDFVYNMDDDGGMRFRLQLPLGRERSGFRPCVDGQFGGIIKAYRDWKIGGDSQWLRDHWHLMKRQIAYAWSEDNPDGWDRDKDGVVEGRQHHTLDMELFGPNSWLTGFYLAALKAGSEMAIFVGEPDVAQEYDALFQRGKAWVDENLFNGQWYHQQVDITDKSILDRYQTGESMIGDVYDAYWDEEHGQIKYQIVDGCEIDQLHAQWQANNCGLGDIFDPVQRKTALASLYRHNFAERIGDVFNACRLYCLNDEGGLLICSWPTPDSQPAVPLPYAQETQNGYEYGAAILMIQEGLVDEGLSAVKAIRDRYDGERRNPWNEFECGSNYARSMASYSLLLTMSRFEYNLVTGLIGFDPLRWEEGRFQCFWSLGTGWGTISCTPTTARIEVLAGELEIRQLHLPYLPGEPAEMMLDNEPITNWEWSEAMVTFSQPLTITPERTLTVAC